MKRGRLREKAMRKFLTPVSAAGIPHRLSVLEKTAGNLAPFCAAEVAKIYWRLKKISCSYSYSIGDQWPFGGQFSIAAQRRPIDRIVEGENFCHRAQNDELKTVSEFSFPLARLSPVGPSYAFRIQFSDRLFPDALFNLSTEPAADATILDRLVVNFLGRDLGFYLATRYSAAVEGRIDGIHFSFEFFEPSA